MIPLDKQGYCSLEAQAEQKVHLEKSEPISLAPSESLCSQTVLCPFRGKEET